MYQITVHPGRTLWEELAEQKIVIERPCGGKGSCGRCSVVLRGGRSVLACQYRTAGEVEIEEIPETRFSAVGALQKSGTYISDPVFVTDIGTTTVVVQLLYQDYIIEKTFVNPQRIYGADVMSRIRSAADGHGEELRRLIAGRLREALDEAWEELSGKICVERQNVRVIVSANTTMQHLLEGISCLGLGTAPFTPARLDLRSFFADGMEFVQLPGISAFVGADIVSGLSAVDLLHRGAPVLFVDLGTNGEMALGCRERLIVASAAAGPAFEGSGPAMRIYGAGVLALVRELLERGILDGYGTLSEEYFESGYPVEAERYRRSGKDEVCGGTAVLTQDDIRELQMAKAAVCAGVEALLDAYGVGAEQVAQVYLAGGFGCYLNPDDALAIGLLPEGLRGRIAAAGNTSLEGAVLYAAEPEIYGPRMDEICRRAELLVLTDCESFKERYIERMNFGLYSD